MIQAVRYTGAIIDVSNYIVLDTETTGVNPRADKIIEIGLVEVKNNEIVNTFKTYVNPGCHIPAAASAVNHIYDKDVANAPTFDEIAPILKDWLVGKIVIAHNSYFDVTICTTLLNNYNYSGRIKYIDTLFYSRCVVKDVPNYKLQTLASHFGIDSGSAHSALADANTCHQLFQICKSLPQENIIAQKPVPYKHIHSSPESAMNSEPVKNYNVSVEHSKNKRKSKNKLISFLLCLFLGYFGVHKFYEGKFGMGLLYFFTLGVFCIGWIKDIFTILAKPDTYYV